MLTSIRLHRENLNVFVFLWENPALPLKGFLYTVAEFLVLRITGLTAWQI